MKKKLVRLTESDLRKMVLESVRKIIREEVTSGNYRFDPSDNYGYVGEMSPEEEREYMRTLDTNWEVNTDKLNDLYDEVCRYLSINPNVTSWEEIAEDFGYNIDALSPDEVERLKDTIEDAIQNQNN